MKGKLEGIIVPMGTAFTGTGGIDQQRTRKLVDYLIEGGIDGLFPLGTSGEFALLDRDERKLVMQTVVDQANNRVPVLVGVSDPSLTNVIHFAKDAKEIGADAIVATPPYYFTTSEEGLYEHFETIASKGDLPLFVYNIPEWTHSFVTPSVVQRLVDARLIAGMKYTEYNLLNLLRFINVADRKISILTGSDAMTFTNLEFGGSGGVIGVANVAPSQASSIFDEFKRGNLEAARKAQLKLLPAIEAIGIGRFPAGLKEAMRLVGMPVGNVREPLQPLTTDEKDMVAGFLKEAELINKGE
ncbi:MAG TPA: dihydrodipicolinate synthase family protein [Candidatus Dormibacteraeota bacterium]|nr:dihydrodipicolinate synthase family protein [Candidatus Dormibacteraeota bacterium]